MELKSLYKVRTCSACEKISMDCWRRKFSDTIGGAGGTRVKNIIETSKVGSPSFESLNFKYLFDGDYALCVVEHLSNLTIEVDLLFVKILNVLDRIAPCQLKNKQFQILEIMVTTLRVRTFKPDGWVKPPQNTASTCKAATRRWGMMIATTLPRSYLLRKSSMRKRKTTVRGNSLITPTR